MRDYDVRAAIRDHLGQEHAGDSSTRIVEEMGVWSGTVRIDVAVINGELSGYELKSDRDTLQRLPAQMEIYNRVFDRLTLVSGSKHVACATRLIPDWWGLIVATETRDGLMLRVEQKPSRNPNPDPYLVAQLLWKEECLTILESLGLAKGYRSKPVKAIHERLASKLPFDDLAAKVRAALKHRVDWLGKSSTHVAEMPV